MILLLMLLSLTVGSFKFEGESVRFDDLTIKRCNASDNYSIHGWWPEYSNKSWPSWCDPSRYKEFNNITISPIKELMDEYWYTCPGWPSPYIFWQHEWEKHGTCVESDSVVEYFNHTINAFLQAQNNNWYDCCVGSDSDSDSDSNDQCMIPFSINPNRIKWLGYCH